MNDTELVIRDGDKETKISGMVERIASEHVGSLPCGGREMMRLEVTILVDRMTIEQLEQIKLGDGRILQFLISKEEKS